MLQKSSKPKIRTASEIETKVLAAIEAGLSYEDIAKRFSMSTKTISRIKKRVNGFQESPEPQKDIAPVKRPDKPSRGERLKKDNEAVQLEISNVAMRKALELFVSIDPEKMPEGQKATSGAILIDKARLITGQAGSITEHRDIQVVALRMLDERQKKDSRKDPNVIDVKATPIESDAPEKAR